MTATERHRWEFLCLPVGEAPTSGGWELAASYGGHVYWQRRWYSWAGQPTGANLAPLVAFLRAAPALGAVMAALPPLLMVRNPDGTWPDPEGNVSEDYSPVFIPESPGSIDVELHQWEEVD
jgi:hypothetical protein